MTGSNSRRLLIYYILSVELTPVLCKIFGIRHIVWADRQYYVSLLQSFMENIRLFLRNSRAYQRADAGYDRRYGSVDRYRAFFREGYVDGYAQGYRRFGSQYGRDDRYGRGPGYGYPPVRDTRYVSAYDNGARDGFEKGREDASGRDRFDPRRHRWYRDAERGYNNRFGSRERYRDEYRRGFLAGYEQGYRR